MYDLGPTCNCIVLHGIVHICNACICHDPRCKSTNHKWHKTPNLMPNRNMQANEKKRFFIHGIDWLRICLVRFINLSDREPIIFFNFSPLSAIYMWLLLLLQKAFERAQRETLEYWLWHTNTDALAYTAEFCIFLNEITIFMNEISRKTNQPFYLRYSLEWIFQLQRKQKQKASLSFIGREFVETAVLQHPTGDGHCLCLSLSLTLILTCDFLLSFFSFNCDD